MTATARVALLTTVMSGTACTIEPIDLNNRSCDAEHPCVDGYECIDDLCELEGSDDEGSGDEGSGDDDGDD